MQKLLKISNDYYVIDDKAEIKRIYYYNAKHNEVGFDSGILTPDETHIAVIASNNPLLPLPQITNASDDMVGKEVEVEIFQGINLLDEERMVAILKPISKETKLCSNCKHCGSLVCKLPGDRYTNCIDLNRKLFEPKETKRICNCKTDAALSCNGSNCNETLEEIAERELTDTIELLEKLGLSNRHSIALVNTCAKVGYKHCEKTMYNADEVLNLLIKFGTGGIDENLNEADLLFAAKLLLSTDKK